ncbi:hypothetical protein JTB14_020308 [Gonioctena quinquepunctata]|nr:hypothetical protein JTB14_020308 [Gonioctena quinquepunctata]
MLPESTEAAAAKGYPQGGVLFPILGFLVVDGLLAVINNMGYDTQANAHSIVILIDSHRTNLDDTINANLHSNATDDMPVDHIDECLPVIGAVVNNNTSVTIVGESHIDDSIIEFDFPEFNTDANFDADLLNVVENPNDIRFSEMKQVIPETPKTSNSVGVETLGTLITDYAFTSSEDSLPDASTVREIQHDINRHEGSSRQILENSANNQELKATIDRYVVVQYEGSYYPGNITQVKSNSLLISTMERSEADWKWPCQKDEIWFDNIEVMETIETPVKNNSLGIYTVKELNKYTNFC